MPYSDQHCYPPILDLGSAHPHPIVIQSIEVLRFSKVCFVRTRSQDGAVGISVCDDRIFLFLPMLKYLVIPVFLQRDLRDLESLINEVYTYKMNYKYHGIPFWNCVAFIEASLLDLFGKATGKSVGDLVGQVQRRSIPVYLSRKRRGNNVEDEIVFMEKRLSETGAGAVKLKIGGRMQNNRDISTGYSESLIIQSRERFGPDVALYFDANGSFDCERAIEIGRLMEKNDCNFFEEPCPFEQYEETRAVADALDIDIVGGEQDCNLGHIREMIRRRIVDIIQPDLWNVGGLIRALRVARMAEEAGMTVFAHGGPIGPGAATQLHFTSVVPNAGPFLEYPATKSRQHSWYSPHFGVNKDGTVTVPDSPGLGISYDPDIWKKARVF